MLTWRDCKAPVGSRITCGGYWQNARDLAKCLTKSCGNPHLCRCPMLKSIERYSIHLTRWKRSHNLALKLLNGSNWCHGRLHGNQGSQHAHLEMDILAIEAGELEQAARRSWLNSCDLTLSNIERQSYLNPEECRLDDLLATDPHVGQLISINTGQTVRIWTFAPQACSQ